jgi:hypothetical protein
LKPLNASASHDIVVGMAPAVLMDHQLVARQQCGTSGQSRSRGHVEPVFGNPTSKVLPRKKPCVTVSKKAVASLIEGSKQGLNICSAGELAMILFSISRLNVNVGQVRRLI